MKRAKLSLDAGFHTSIGNERAQLAIMVIEPGDKEGGPDNRHVGADQWLLVLEGSGEAIIGGTRVKLEAGSVVLIEAGEKHEIRNTGGGAMKTVNLYVPPAYDEHGEELPAGRNI